MCALDLSRRTHNACPTCAPRVPRVCLALVQRALRMAGVLLACTFMRRAPRTVLCMHKNPDAHDERRRMHSALDARVAHGDAHPANDDALAKIATFSVRGPCVVPV